MSNVLFVLFLQPLSQSDESNFISLADEKAICKQMHCRRQKYISTRYLCGLLLERLIADRLWDKDTASPSLTCTSFIDAVHHQGGLSAAIWMAKLPRLPHAAIKGSIENSPCFLELLREKMREVVSLYWFCLWIMETEEANLSAGIGKDFQIAGRSLRRLRHSSQNKYHIETRVLEEGREREMKTVQESAPGSALNSSD